jgi:hypothetical protein
MEYVLSRRRFFILETTGRRMMIESLNLLWAQKLILPLVNVLAHYLVIYRNSIMQMAEI